MIKEDKVLEISIVKNHSAEVNKDIVVKEEGMILGIKREME